MEIQVTQSEMECPSCSRQIQPSCECITTFKHGYNSTAFLQRGGLKVKCLQKARVDGEKKKIASEEHRYAAIYDG